jgi:hypothetical protein
VLAWIRFDKKKEKKKGGTMAGEQAGEAFSGGKKRTLEEANDNVSNDDASADDAAAQGINSISTLLTAAARLEPTKSGSRGAGDVSTGDGSAPTTETVETTTETTETVAETVTEPKEEPALAGISTLLEIASTMVHNPVDGKTEAQAQAQQSPGDAAPQSEGSGDEALCEERPHKRPAGADPDLYPTDKELIYCRTRRFRAAMYSWYDRFRDLTLYEKEHGDCQVPQKYPPNHALGVVRTVVVVVGTASFVGGGWNLVWGCVSHTWSPAVHLAHSLLFA